MKRYLAMMAIFLSTHTAFAAEKSSAAFHWPKNIKAAVSLSYDDALDSQLDNAIPTLNKYNLKGSFYLKLSNTTIAARLPEWRAIAKDGHELGNHTLFHQCSAAGPGREWVMPQDDLDKMSVAQIKDQILLANSMLYAIDGKRERTFTTPCGDLNAGGQNYISAVKSEFVAIKSIMGSGVTPNMNTMDPYAVSVNTPTNVTGKQLIDIVKEGAAKGTMVNFTFHGIGGDHLQTSKEAHDELLKYLADNRDIYWTDTFINIMKYVKAQQQ